MDGNQTNALNRIAFAISEAREDLRELILTLKGEPLEHAEEMLKTLEAVSDDGTAECSSGIMCDLYESMK